MSIYYPNIINPNLPTSGGGSSTVSNPMTQDLDMGGNAIISSGPAGDPSGVPTLGQVQALITAGGGGSSIDGLTAINDVLKYNGNNVLIAQPPTSTNIETLSISSNYVANSMLLAFPHSSPIHNNPPKTAENFTTANTILNDNNAMTIDAQGNFEAQSSLSGLSSARTNFVFNGGCSLTLGGMGMTSAAGTYQETVIAFYVNTPIFDKDTAIYSVLLNNNPGDANTNVNIQYFNTANEWTTLNLEQTANFTDTISVVYTNVTFELYINGARMMEASSENSQGVNMSLARSSNLCLVGMMSCNINTTIINPSFSQSSTLALVPNLISNGSIVATATSSITPSINNNYLTHISFPLNPISPFPQVIKDPTTNSLLEIFILNGTDDDSGYPANLMTTGPAFSFYSPSSYFSWNQSTSIMTFNYQSQAQNPKTTADTNDYFYTASNWNSAVALSPPYTYYYVWTTFQQTYTFSSTPTLTCSVSQNVGNPYIYPLCSQNDGTSTNIAIGNHGEEKIIFTGNDMFYNSNKFITTANVASYVSNINGLNIDPITKLLQFNNQAVMINQYAGQVIPQPMTIYPQTYPFSLQGTIQIDGQVVINNLATITINDTFSDLFLYDNGFNFKVHMTSNLPISQIPFTFPTSGGGAGIPDPGSPTQLWVNILDKDGNNIVPNLAFRQFTFIFYNTGWTYDGTNLVFSRFVDKSSTPNSNDAFNFYTMPLNTSAQGPFTINYGVLSNNNITSTLTTITGFVGASFSVNFGDISNPYPVVSNYDGNQQITTIRTGAYGPIIKTAINGDTSITTNSLSLIPSIGPQVSATSLSKWRKGVVSGNESNSQAPNQNIHYVQIQIPNIPQSSFYFTYTLFFYINSQGYQTTTATGIVDIQTTPISFDVQNASIINQSTTPVIYANTLVNSLPNQSTFAVSFQQYSNTRYNYTLTYEFIII